MEYRRLGTTGLSVSTLCLGTMMFGSWGNPDEASCRRMLDMALDAGVNVVDTADLYDAGRSEEMLGRALGRRRPDVIVATKFGNPLDAGPNHRGGSRRWVVEAVEGSLRRLHTDYVDLYQMHRPHDEADLGETLSALTDLVRAGKVRAIGTSTFPPSLLVEAARVATELGLQRFATEQPPYSALARGVEREVLPVAGDLGLGVAVWAPLNGGWLSGRYRRGEVPPPDSRARREPDHFDWELPVAKVKLDAVAALEEVAAAVGLSLVHLALGFVLSHPSVTTAIIGPRTPEQLEAMLDLPVDRLTGATLDRIDAIVAPGVDLNPADRGHVPAALADPRLRRR